MKIYKNSLIGLLFVLILMVGCGTQTSGSDLVVTDKSCEAGSKKVWVEVGRNNEIKKYCVELAITPLEREVGLMNRQEMKSDQGMLFEFEQADYQGFWMRDTNFALDILFFDENKKLVDQKLGFEPCKQMPCVTYVSKKPAKYVLEVLAK